MITTRACPVNGGRSIGQQIGAIQPLRPPTFVAGPEGEIEKFRFPVCLDLDAASPNHLGVLIAGLRLKLVKINGRKQSVGDAIVCLTQMNKDGNLIGG